MESLKVYYADLNNMGDQLSKYIIPAVTGRTVEHCEKVGSFQIMGIGSCGGAVWGGKEDDLRGVAKDIIKKTMCIKKPTCAVWGTGFFADYRTKKLSVLRDNVEYIALRGAYSKEVVEHSLGRKLGDIPLCDGGILASALFDKPNAKKYAVGIIPHIAELKQFREMELLTTFEKAGNEAVLINLRDEPLKVIQQISECEVILSSSLHGCVVADSFHVPNVLIRVSSIPGGEFKFNDYYSGYGLQSSVIHVKSKADLPSSKEVEMLYKISPEAVEKKKDEMRNALLQFLSTI